MVENEYTILDYMKKRWETVGRKFAFSASSPEEFRNWKAKTAAKLKELIGYDTMLSCELNLCVNSSEDKGDHIRSEIVIQTEPGVWMPMWVLEPKNAAKPYTPVIAAHGHCGGGKDAVAGIKDNNEIASAIEEYNYDYGLELCRAGFLVFCPDARGFGLRKEALSLESVLKGSCRELNNMAIPLGQTVTGMWTWDIHRLIDYIQTREDCNSKKVCCTGLSGGGHQVLWASALDERIKCTVVSGYYYGYKQALLELYDNCSCNYIPHLWEYVDMCDIAALIAPRALFIETGDVDPLNGNDGLNNVISQLEITRRAYRLGGSENKLKHSIQQGSHKWFGTGITDWLKEETLNLASKRRFGCLHHRKVNLLSH